MLDAACGVGFDALSLHRRGFRVTATDASPAMAARARERLAAAGADVSVTRCHWAELPDRFGPEFDAVLCTGNSLAHAPSTTARRAALGGFANVLLPGGTLIVDTQDWSVVHGRGDHRDDDPQVITRGGRRATRHFDWRVPDRFGDPVVLELVLVVRNGDEEERTRHAVTFCPFTTEELVADLAATGFLDVEVRQNPDDDRYCIVARRGPSFTRDG